MVEAVLFDLDGTFADTAPDLGAALNRMLREDDRPEVPIPVLRPYASHGVRGLLGVGYGVSRQDERYGELTGRFLDYYAQSLCVKTALFAGIPETLEALRCSGLRWGIVTNKRQRYTLPLLDSLGYARTCGCMVSGDSAPRPKPSPAPLLLASRLLGVEPERCVYVGDDARDMEAARAAGMHAVAAAYGYLGAGAPIEDWQADRIIAAPRELLELVGLAG
ncbi:MAG TPA: phosphoglycolate phosphatase [Rhodocyclaceae bacterium]|nr:MAG: phosphoglycolate phosphatase [Betaproteobacteria bacterium CG2_30_68_42]PIV76628.1 MAG: phosphoglycolate phosphatase [Rhodocyclales bacterium CG17_big_fil_post_rev_8_21_14_2_50_68_7]PIX75941.1 MAG: phosphoglycolate phosphatase [Rhodocyclales bacterium CG_4_10_14_3_um_filter_68_10]HCX34911.1 phosphoglycolate phosphatase [Rhodocyclaceae bacterium]